MKRVTIHDVASQAGVSIATISRYLNGRYEAMSDRTRRRIADVIDELDYRPNALAQGLKGNRTRIVAAVVVNTSYPFCVGFLRTLGNTLSSAGYHLFVCESGGNELRERQIIESLLDQRVDAIVVQSDGHNNHLLADIARSMPVVFADRGYDVPTAYHVTTNNFELTYQVASHLIDEGYQRIIYVTEDPNAIITTRQHRLDGYRAACQTVGLEPIEIIVSRKDITSYQAVYEAMPVASQNGTVPIAVFTANSLLMGQLYKRLTTSGLSVPGQLGLATFDDPDWAQFVEPSLTCVRQPAVEMGEDTAKRLLDLLEKHSEIADSDRHVVIPSTLLLGTSTRRDA